MEPIAIRSNAGRYLTVNDDPGKPMVLKPPPLTLRAVFYRIPSGPRFTLRAFATGGFVAVAGAHVVTRPDAATEFEFRYEPSARATISAPTPASGSPFVLKDMSDGSVGRALSYSNETYWYTESLQVLMTALDSHTCCGNLPPRTGSGGDAIVLQLLVQPLIAMVGSLVAPIVSLVQFVIPAAEAMALSLMPVVSAARSLQVGLGKAGDILVPPAVAGHPPAETLPPGVDPRLAKIAEGHAAANHEPYTAPASLFSAHYYDPDSRQNFLGSGATAMTECVRWFGESARADDDGDALFKLGLALHFLGDCCRPLHAANLAPIVGEPSDGIARDGSGSLLDWRHSLYEVVAASEAAKVAPSGAVMRYNDVETLAHGAARIAKNIFNDSLRDAARIKRANGTSSWTAEEVAPAARDTAALTGQMSEALLVLWSKNRRLRDWFRPLFTPGRAGKWLFRAAGASEEWWPGPIGHARGKGAASVEILSYGRVKLSGTYDFMWGPDWNNGSMYIDIRDIGPDSCTLEIGQFCHRGNIWGQRDRGANAVWSIETRSVSHDVSSDGRLIYRDRDRIVMTQSFYQPAGWSPAIRFELQFNGATQNVIFECV